MRLVLVFILITMGLSGLSQYKTVEEIIGPDGDQTAVTEKFFKVKECFVKYDHTDEDTKCPIQAIYYNIHSKSLKIKTAESMESYYFLSEVQNTDVMISESSGDSLAVFWRTPQQQLELFFLKQRKQVSLILD